MAMTLDADQVGLYAVVWCEAVGCERHVAVRPAEIAVNPRELLEVALDWAFDEGWLLVGATWCPDHGGAEGARLTGTVGEGRSWARIASPVVNRRPRPS